MERSFFRGLDHVVNKNFAAAVDYVLLARRADTLAVVYSISDSVYYYTIDGERVGAMRMPADSFRLVEPVLPGERINTDMAFRKTWMESLDVVSRIVWLGDGTLVLRAGRRSQPMDLGDHQLTGVLFYSDV